MSKKIIAFFWQGMCQVVCKLSYFERSKKALVNKSREEIFGTETGGYSFNNFSIAQKNIYRFALCKRKSDARLGSGIQIA